MGMKRIIFICLLIHTTLSAQVEIKDGNYSWYKGGSQAFLELKKIKENYYHIRGECLYGAGRKYGPNMGSLDFNASLKNKQIIYHYNEIGKYTFVLSLNKDGSFDVDEKGDIPFGHNASFYGHFTRDDLPSFSCSKASTFIEKAICSNVEIAKLDRKMARVYTQYKSAFFFEKNRTDLENKLKKEQRKWIKTRDKCESQKAYKVCLTNAYKKRIEIIDSQFGNFWKYD